MRNLFNFRIRPKDYTGEVKKEEYGIEIFYKTTPFCVAIFYSGKSLKPRQHYRYRSEEEMMTRINEFVASIEKYEKAKAEEKAIVKGLNGEMKAENHFKLGDIIVNSWGWEQTNIDFYQVVEILNKKIRVQRIKGELLEYEGNGMAGYVMPLANQFSDKEPFLLSLKVDKSGKCWICNPKSYYYFHKWGGAKQYCSWYA